MTPEDEGEHLIPWGRADDERDERVTYDDADSLLQ